MARGSHKQRTALVDGDKVASLMREHGWTAEDLAAKADVSTGTISKLLSGTGRPYWKTVSRLRNAFGLDSFDPLLADTADALHAADSTSPAELSGQATIHEYQVADVLTDWISASNGLKFQICRLRHLELDRLARGKRYDLGELSTEQEDRCRAWIKRHPDVCEALRDHPNIIRNLTAFRDPREPFYWVIDEWVEGQSLERRLRSGLLSRNAACDLMLDVAEGLHALHGQRIIRRELTPASILIRAADGRAILSEFELAKLIDRGSSVSTEEWPTDPYRAPEADSDDVNEQADLYSWARISTHALLGELPEPEQEHNALQRLRLPQTVAAILQQCLCVFRSRRPVSFQPVIPVLKRWRAT